MSAEARAVWIDCLGEDGDGDVRERVYGGRLVDDDDGVGGLVSDVLSVVHW